MMSLHMLISKCASHHNSVTSQLPKAVPTWCLSHFDFEMCFAALRHALFEHHNFQKRSEPDVISISKCYSCHSGVHCLITVSTSQLLCFFFNGLTSESASRHRGVHFFSISTSKSCPNVCFFLIICWRSNVLRATTPCTFSTSQLPKVLRRWSALFLNVFNMLNHVYFDMCFGPQGRALFEHLNWTSKSAWRMSTCASRHNGVHFSDIPTDKTSSGGEVLLGFWLPNLLRAKTASNFWALIWPDGSAPAAFASLLFDLPGAQTVAKHSVSRLFCLFAHLHLVSYSFLFSDSTFAVSSVHTVESSTSELPSIKLTRVWQLWNIGFEFGSLERAK